MSDKEFYDMIEKLIKHALEEDHTKFVQLRSLSEYRNFRSIVRSYRAVIVGLEAGVKRLSKSYYKDITCGCNDTTKAMAYRQMLDVVDFYYQEIYIINQMLKEYRLYLQDGHLLSALLGEQRSNRDLTNYLDKE